MRQVKKYALLVIGIFLMIAALSLREWLLIEEISITENQLIEQATQTFEAAQSLDRIQHLTTSAVAYERFLEPVIEIANRLLWPPSREDFVSEWKRNLHAELDNLSAARIAFLSSGVEKEIQKIRSDSKPTLNRLYEIVKLSENRSTQMSCSQTVQEEMKFIKEAGQRRDQELLASLRTEGITQLKRLEKTVKGMNPSQLSTFFTSGRFQREFEQPILDYALQIKQEELRKSAWLEFQKKLSETLSKKKVPLAKVIDRSVSAKKEIEKIFNSLAEAKNTEITLEAPPEALPEPRPIFPETETPSSPSAMEVDPSEASSDLQSPSDSASQN